jgi:hypothetical protein
MSDRAGATIDVRHLPNVETGVALDAFRAARIARTGRLLPAAAAARAWCNCAIMVVMLWESTLPRSPGTERSELSRIELSAVRDAS